MQAPRLHFFVKKGNSKWSNGIFLLPLHSLLKVLPIKFSPSRGVRGGLTIFLTPRMGACA